MSDCSPFEARDAREDDTDTHTDTDIEIELRIQANKSARIRRSKLITEIDEIKSKHST